MNPDVRGRPPKEGATAHPIAAANRRQAKEAGPMSHSSGPGRQRGLITVVIDLAPYLNMAEFDLEYGPGTGPIYVPAGAYLRIITPGWFCPQEELHIARALRCAVLAAARWMVESDDGYAAETLRDAIQLVVDEVVHADESDRRGEIA